MGSCSRPYPSLFYIPPRCALAVTAFWCCIHDVDVGPSCFVFGAYCCIRSATNATEANRPAWATCPCCVPTTLEDSHVDIEVNHLCFRLHELDTLGQTMKRIVKKSGMRGCPYCFLSCPSKTRQQHRGVDQADDPMCSRDTRRYEDMQTEQQHVAVVQQYSAPNRTVR